MREATYYQTLYEVVIPRAHKRLRFGEPSTATSAADLMTNQ